MNGEFWTSDEDTRLRALAPHHTVYEAAEQMPGRTWHGVIQRARRLGISFKAKRIEPKWPAYASDLLRHYWNVEGLSAGKCAAKLGISRNAAIGRAHRMGLDKRASPIIRRGRVLRMPMPRRGCEYGLGDPKEPAFEFCGKPRQRGSSYCAAHHKLCYRRLPAKKDSPQPFTFTLKG